MVKVTQVGRFIIIFSTYECFPRFIIIVFLKIIIYTIIHLFIFFFITSRKIRPFRTDDNPAAAAAAEKVNDNGGGGGRCFFFREHWEKIRIRID